MMEDIGQALRELILGRIEAYISHEDIHRSAGGGGTQGVKGLRRA